MSSSSASTPFRASRRALRDEVYDALLEMLVDGHLGAGEALGIDPLSVQLGVSPTPVREALVQLESTGLVTRTALRGYKVAPPMSREAMEQLFDARVLLEEGAARRAVAHRESLVPQLRRVLEEQRDHGAALVDAPEGDASVKDLSDYLADDRAFHDAIFQATGNRFFIEMARHISVHGQRLRQFVEHHHVDAELAVAEHERILRAMEAGDADEVAETMRVHILAVRERTLSDAES
ncbi:GntR family transcriptional regulator [Georgenia halophila]|uniref:GntR family transcriptional regulator n=1 Tax=Georgenia halophila TaxID=620889 RepID=A0ABP8LF57_9MICO